MTTPSMKLLSAAGGGATTFSPDDIPSLAFWFDASDASTITDVGGGEVSSWADKSASGFDLTQGTSSLRPATGSTTVNGLNALTFFDDWLQYSGAVLDMSAATVFVVARETTVLAAAGLVALHPSVGSDFSGGIVLEVDDASNLFAAVRFLSGLNGRSRFAGAGATPIDIWAGRFASDGVVGAFRGSAGAATESTSSATFGTAQGLLVGGRYLSGAVAGTNRLRGDVCEIVGFNATLSAADMNSVGDYLASKWGQTWTSI